MAFLNVCLQNDWIILEWFTQMVNMWTGWPDQALPNGMNLLYKTYFVVHVHELLSLIWLDPLMSDFLFSFLHHLVTLFCHMVVAYEIFSNRIMHHVVARCFGCLVESGQSF